MVSSNIVRGLGKLSVEVPGDRRAGDRLWKCHERRNLRQGTTTARAVVATQCEDLMRIFITEKETDLETLASSLARTPRAAAAYARARPGPESASRRCHAHPEGRRAHPPRRAGHQGRCRHGRRWREPRRDRRQIRRRRTRPGEPRRGPPRVTHRRSRGGARRAQERGSETPGRERPAAAEAARGRRRGIQGRAEACHRSTQPGSRSSPRPHRPNSRACRNSSAEEPRIRPGSLPPWLRVSSRSWARDTLPTASRGTAPRVRDKPACTLFGFICAPDSLSG